MGGRSKSSSSSKVTTNNINLANNSGIALANSSGNTITTTDHGAVEGAFEFGSDALNTVYDAVDGAFNVVDSVAGKSLGVAERSTENALLFGDSAMSHVSDFATDALEQTNNVMLQSQAQSSQQLAAVTDLAKSVQSQGQSSQNETLIKMATIGGVVVVVVLVGVALAARGGK